LARALVSLPFVPRLAAWQAGGKGAVERLLAGTGSTLDSRGVALYRQVVANPGHVAGALGMMAAWDLRALVRELPKLRTPVLQLIGAQDRTIPPSDAERLQRILPSARKVMLPGLGHLAHEQAPA
jgi:magnesium chelatase accessory protein